MEKRHYFAVHWNTGNRSYARDFDDAKKAIKKAREIERKNGSSYPRVYEITSYDDEKGVRHVHLHGSVNYM